MEALVFPLGLLFFVSGLAVTIAISILRYDVRRIACGWTRTRKIIDTKLGEEIYKECWNCGMLGNKDHMDEKDVVVEEWRRNPRFCYIGRYEKVASIEYTCRRCVAQKIDTDFSKKDWEDRAEKIVGEAKSVGEPVVLSTKKTSKKKSK